MVPSQFNLTKGMSMSSGGSQFMFTGAVTPSPSPEPTPECITMIGAGANPYGGEDVLMDLVGSLHNSRVQYYDQTNTYIRWSGTRWESLYGGIPLYYNTTDQDLPPLSGWVTDDPMNEPVPTFIYDCSAFTDCILASGGGTTDANGVYTLTGSIYLADNGYYMEKVGVGFWALYNTDDNPIYQSNGDSSRPPLTGWSVTASGTGPVPTFEYIECAGSPSPYGGSFVGATISGAGWIVWVEDQLAPENGTLNGKPYYGLAESTGDPEIYWDNVGFTWNIGEYLGSTLYISFDSGPVPPSTGWSSSNPFDDPPPTVTLS